MMDTGWGYDHDSPINTLEGASSSPPTRNQTHNSTSNFSTTRWHNGVNRNMSYGGYTDDYNSYFGSVYGDVHTYLKIILDVLTLVAIAATGATLLIIIVHKRLHKQHHIFSTNITLAGLVTACSVGLRVLIPSNSKECPFFCKLLVFIPCFAAIISNINILMVAVYQLINIRIDPFGSRAIVTTLRCVIASLLSWSIVGALGITGLLFSGTGLFLLLLTIVSILTTVFTGWSYFLIYRSVTGATSACIVSKQRKEENSRILQTIALVYGSDFFLAIFPSAYWVMNVLAMEWAPLLYLSTLSYVLSSVTNSIVYWWRLKEFKVLLSCCQRNQRVEPTRDQSFKTEKIVLENIG